MPTLSPSASSGAQPEPHTARQMAESFGADAELYDRARPSYPDALIARIVQVSPGADVLDVGCGTGIAARQFRAAGCRVLGVEPDDRVAEFARAGGLSVETATFEKWASRGRTFDTVVAAQSWHWVDPAAGTAKAAEVLRPRGRLAVFGHLFEPPEEIADPFAEALRAVAPDSLLAGQPARRPVQTYQTLYAGVADTIRQTGSFDEAEQWRFDWQQRFSRDQWLALLPTTGVLTRLRRDLLARVLSAVGRAIDAQGGYFTMPWTTLATVAARNDQTD